jgi:hypothetical protein
MQLCLTVCTFPFAVVLFVYHNEMSLIKVWDKVIVACVIYHFAIRPDGLRSSTNKLGNIL